MCIGQAFYKTLIPHYRLRNKKTKPAAIGNYPACLLLLVLTGDGATVGKRAYLKGLLEVFSSRAGNRELDFPNRL
jgi:hypothetical protein